MELVVDFPLASIKSDEHLVEAQRVIDELIARGLLDDTCSSINSGDNPVGDCGKSGTAGDRADPCEQYL